MAEKQQKQTQKERLKEITDSIETGIKELFESEKYMQYLRTMSRFHKYSLNNTMLISMQRPDATLVAGFNKWRDAFSRNVKKGEKGIKIIAPTPYKVKEEREKLDPQTKAPLLDSSGKVQLEEVERQIPVFRVVSVFDVSQTEGKELPQLVSSLNGTVEQFDVFVEALKRAAPVPITIEPMPSNTDGFFSPKQQRIAIREGMSEVQTLCAMIHEIAHAKLHDPTKLPDAPQTNQDEPQPEAAAVRLDRNTEEVQAESISFAVCNYYGIETSENSFGYIANWSKGKELKELKASLEVINKTSSVLISDIDKHFAEVQKERPINEQLPQEATTQPQELAYHIHDYLFAIHESSEGYEYSTYTLDHVAIDGGVLEDESMGIYEAISEIICEDFAQMQAQGQVEQLDYAQLMERADEAEQAQIAQHLAEQAQESMAQANVPDPSVSAAAIHAYGYTAAELLPMQKDRAIALFNEEVAIYALYPDNTEAFIFDANELFAHDGYFGVEKEDWQHYQQRDSSLDTVEQLTEQNYNMIDGVRNNEPIGRIDYLANNGTVAEPVEYSDAAAFQEAVTRGTDCGAPFSIAIYQNERGESIQTDWVYQLDPPPLGVSIEAPPSGAQEVADQKKSVLAQLRQPPVESKKDKQAFDKNAEMER